MSPSLATLLFLIGIPALFLLDRGEKKQVSKAFWIPTIWVFICLSRPASIWLGDYPEKISASLYTDGSPVDRNILGALEAAALMVVIGRRQKVGAILRKNWAIGLFFLYAALSIFWSDYPVVTIKHWVKGIGDVMMILIVLTESNVSNALRSLVTRLGYVLVPLSVLFIKYLPMLGRRLTLSWTMEPVGVATQKNGLGEMCVILGLGLLWRMRNVYIDREDPHRKRRMLAQAVTLSMVVWLLYTCNSMTSISGFTMASAVMLLSTRPAFRRRPALVHLVSAGVPAFSSFALFFESAGGLLQSLGRDPTLTGRTDAWQFVLSVPNNRLVGAGYETFWVGPRLEQMWKLIPGLKIQEAHNGYIEMLLNLGWVGVVLLGLLIVTGYKSVMAASRRSPDVSSLKLALLLSAVNTGFTEAAFRMMGPPWLVFLLATIATPLAATDPVSAARQDDRRRPDRKLPWHAPEPVALILEESASKTVSPEPFGKRSQSGFNQWRRGSALEGRRNVPVKSDKWPTRDKRVGTMSFFSGLRKQR